MCMTLGLEMSSLPWHEIFCQSCKSKITRLQFRVTSEPAAMDFMRKEILHYAMLLYGLIFQFLYAPKRLEALVWGIAIKWISLSHKCHERGGR